ncbi:hypothetical protein PBS_20960 [Paraburkholderia sp. 2C]
MPDADMNQIAVGVIEPEAHGGVTSPFGNCGSIAADAASRVANLTHERTEMCFKTAKAKVCQRLACRRQDARPPMAVERAQFQMQVRPVVNVAHVKATRVEEVSSVVKGRDIKREMVDRMDSTALSPDVRAHFHSCGKEVS